MNPAGRLFAVILVSGFLSGTSSLEGSRRDCPSAAIVDLTESGDVFPPEAIWRENGRTFGCPCKFKDCLRLCCPMDEAIGRSGCVEERDVSSVSSENEFIPRGIHLFIDEPCSTDHPLIRSSRSIVESYIRQETLRTPSKEQGSCYYSDAAPFIFLVGICGDDDEDGLLPWFLGCVNISMLFTLATFIVYSVIPELKNFQGLIFRCYLASYICCMISLTIFISMVLFSRPITVWLADQICDDIFGLGCGYFGAACMLWLNVMSIDIWRTFRKLRSSRDFSMEIRQKKQFVRYSIYAWCGSAAIVPIIVIIPLTSPDAVNGWMYAAASLTSAIAICNICLYVWTALKIKQLNKETAHVVGSANKHQQETERWFNLYLKLFLIMGGPMILWSVAIFCRNAILWRVVYTMEGLQGILIFLIFVWKDDVKKLLRKRFDEVLRKLGSCWRRDSTPTIEI